jgi:hypothetical protein
MEAQGKIDKLERKLKKCRGLCEELTCYNQQLHSLLSDQEIKSEELELMLKKTQDRVLALENNSRDSYPLLKNNINVNPKDNDTNDDTNTNNYNNNNTRKTQKKTKKNEKTKTNNEQRGTLKFQSENPFSPLAGMDQCSDMDSKPVLYSEVAKAGLLKRTNTLSNENLTKGAGISKHKKGPEKEKRKKKNTKAKAKQPAINNSTARNSENIVNDNPITTIWTVGWKTQGFKKVKLLLSQEGVNLKRIANLEWRGKVLEIHCHGRAAPKVAEILQGKGHPVFQEINKANIEVAYPISSGRVRKMKNDCRRAAKVVPSIYEKMNTTNMKWWEVYYATRPILHSTETKDTMPVQILTTQTEAAETTPVTQTNHSEAVARTGENAQRPAYNQTEYEDFILSLGSVEKHMPQGPSSTEQCDKENLTYHNTNDLSRYMEC